MPVIIQAVSAEVTLSSILSDIGTFFEAAISWLGKALDTVTGSPVLFIMVVAIPVSMVAIAILRRLIRV